MDFIKYECIIEFVSKFYDLNLGAKYNMKFYLHQILYLSINCMLNL